MNSLRTELRIAKAAERLADAVELLVDKMDAAEDVLIEDPPEKITGTVDDGEKRCMTCGLEYSAQFVFCPYCGRPLIELE